MISQIHYFPPCAVSCLVTSLLSNANGFAGEISRSIAKGINTTFIISIIMENGIHQALISGIGIVFSGRFMCNRFKSKSKSVSYNALCVGRYGNRILDIGQVSLCSVIGVACIKVGILW